MQPLFIKPHFIGLHKLFLFLGVGEYVINSCLLFFSDEKRVQTYCRNNNLYSFSIIFISFTMLK